MSGSTNVKRLLLTAIAVVLLPVYLFAGNTGKITGIVKDKETGDALPGVNVVLEGTSMGAATNAKGEYSIQAVPAGVYTVTTNMISYAKISKQNVRVIPDFTTKLDFELTPTSVSGEEQIVIAERPLIQKDQTMTMTVTSADEIKNLPLRGFQAVANLGTGIILGNNVRNVEGGTGNINIRGGRPNEVGVYIDGFQQNNLLTGISTAQVPSGAVEEVQVITGGFDAEYGRNQSGIIQVTTKGGTSKYGGYAEYVSDKLMNVIDKKQYFNYNVYSGGFGGPVIPGNNRIKFYVSAEGNNTQDAEPSILGNPVVSFNNTGVTSSDPTVNDTAIFATNANGDLIYKKGARPTNFSGYGVNSNRSGNGQMKLTFDAIENKLRFDVSGNYGETVRRIWLQRDLLAPNQETKRTGINANLGFIATYNVNATSFFDVGFNYFYNDRKTNDDQLGRNLRSYQDYSVGNTGQVWYYGDNLLFDIGSAELPYQETQDKYGAVKGSYTNQIDKHNNFRLGFDYFQHIARKMAISVFNPFTGLTDNTGFGINPDYSTYETTKDDFANKALGPGKPWSFDVFGQEKLEYEGLVLRGGLRFDAFNPGTKRLKNLAEPTNGEGAPLGHGDNVLEATDFEAAKTFKNVSPRLSVSFPVSEKSQFRLSYGQFFQQPNLTQLYVGPAFLELLSLVGGTAVRGGVANPNLKPERSTQYEVGFRHTLSEFAVLDVSAFYKDISDLVQIVLTQSSPNALYLLTNDDEGVVQGFTVAFELRRVGKFSGRLNYTLSSAVGTGSTETTGFNAAWLGFDQTKFNAPLAFDQRHTINASFDIRNAKGEGPVFGNVKPLENAGVNFIINAGSGQPYTPREVVKFGQGGVTGSKPIARRNSENLPWTFRIDMKADRSFSLNNSMNLDVYLQVLNLLNRKNVVTVFDGTGQPTDDGYLRTPDGQAQNTRVVQQYNAVLNDGFAFDTPRQVRLGLIFNF